MRSSYSRIGILAIIGLVCLRFLVGYHFFMEGLVKVKEGGFSSAGFLGNAVGPLAPYFRSMVPDYEGRIRTDAEGLKAKFDDYGQIAADRYGFDEQQRNEAKAAVAQAQATIDSIFDDWRNEVTEFQAGFERIEMLQADPTRENVASLREQRSTIESEWRSKAKPVLAQVDGTINILTGVISQLATPDQRAKVGGIVPFVVQEQPIDTSWVDKVIPIFDMSVGILLILGLLTPVAGTLAGLFLLSVVLTQFPGAVGAQPTYYQAIEAAACFLLAFTDAGRYAGLDFIPWAFWQRRRARRAALRRRTSVASTKVVAV